MACKVGVAESKPRLPEDPVFSKTEVKEFLLTKCTYIVYIYFSL